MCNAFLTRKATLCAKRVCQIANCTSFLVLCTVIISLFCAAVIAGDVATPAGYPSSYPTYCREVAGEMLFMVGALPLYDLANLYLLRRDWDEIAQKDKKAATHHWAQHHKFNMILITAMIFVPLPSMF